MAKKNQNRTNKHKKKEYKSNVTNDVLDLRGPGADGVRRLGLDKNRAMRDIMTEMYENAPPFHIEGTLRHRENIIKAQKCYGDIFHVKIVPTKWFYKDNGGNLIEFNQAEKAIMLGSDEPTSFPKWEIYVLNPKNS